MDHVRETPELTTGRAAEDRRLVPPLFDYATGGTRTFGRAAVLGRSYAARTLSRNASACVLRFLAAAGTSHATAPARPGGKADAVLAGLGAAFQPTHRDSGRCSDNARLRATDVMPHAQCPGTQ